jgi:hypothetical protein
LGRDGTRRRVHPRSTQLWFDEKRFSVEAEFFDAFANVI